jgi:hypothetical protein
LYENELAEALRGGENIGGRISSYAIMVVVMVVVVVLMVRKMWR